jgi:hypothetical protein
VQIPPRLAPLLAQFDFAWDRLLARLDGLTDDEYRWEPVADTWSIRPRSEARASRIFGAGPWVFEQDKVPPEPAPFTTIAWRMGHLAVSLAMRADYTIGTKALTWDGYVFHGDAAGGLAALAEAGTAWRAALTSADDAALDQVGRSQFPWGLDPTLPFLDICWWVNQEVLHHGGEIALLRDLYRARSVG